MDGTIYDTNKYARLKQIYVIQADDDSVKVGVSCDVEKRIRAIATGSGKIIKKVWATDWCSNAYEIESKIKEAHKDQKINGEWFACDFENMVADVATIFNTHSLLELRNEDMEERINRDICSMMLAAVGSEQNTSGDVEKVAQINLADAKMILKKHIEAFTDLCGEDDEMCTLPAVEALGALEKVLEYFKDIAYLETAV